MGLRTMPHHSESVRTNKEQNARTSRLVEKLQAVMIPRHDIGCRPYSECRSRPAAHAHRAGSGRHRGHRSRSHHRRWRLDRCDGAHRRSDRRAFHRRRAGRGQQLAAGAKAAKGPWLLFLHADTTLEDGWEREALELMRAVELGAREDTAAVFRYALDDRGVWPAYLSAVVRLRCLIMRMPYGDQGLLMSKRLYNARRRVQADDADGGCRPDPASRAPPRRVPALARHHQRAALPQRRLFAADDCAILPASASTTCACRRACSRASMARLQPGARTADHHGEGAALRPRENPARARDRRGCRDRILSLRRPQI